jgi:hypothetical protein
MAFISSKIQAFFYHFISPFSNKRNQYNTRKYKTLRVYNILVWLTLIPLKFLEIFGFSYVLNSIFRVSIKSRYLTKNEVKYLKTIFPNTINYQLIRINEYSKWAKIGAKNTKKKHLAFVWMNTINFTRPINCQSNLSDLRWLVHEMVHIAQFKKLGIQYVFEALLAQKFGGYNYGSKENLKGHQLNYFNLEQQADIIKDYVLDLSQNKDVTIYKTYLNDLQQYKF